MGSALKLLTYYILEKIMPDYRKMTDYSLVADTIRYYRQKRSIWYDSL